MKIAEAFVEVRPDTSGFSRDLDRGVTSEVRRSQSGIGRAASGVGTALKFGILGGVAAAGVGVVSLVTKTVGDLGNLQRLSAQTTAAIKSTGGAANVSAMDVVRLSDR